MKTFQEIVDKFSEIVNFAPFEADTSETDIITKHASFNGYDTNKKYIGVSFFCK